MSKSTGEISLDISTTPNENVKSYQQQGGGKDTAIPNQNQPAPNKDNTKKDDPSIVQHCSYLKNQLNKCLRDTADKTVPVEDDRSKAAGAYKKLMEDLEGEHREKRSVVIMRIVHALVLLMFIVFLVVTRSVPEINSRWLLHLRIHGWVGLLMVLVSGLPFIHFVTHVVSEPFVWVWKMQKYTMIFARELKKSIDVTLWFMLILWVWYAWFRPEVVKDTRGAHTLHIPVDMYTHILKIVVKQVTRLLLALTVGALIWTLKTALFLKLLSDLHFKELCDSIRQSILDLHGIQFIQAKGKNWKFLTSTNQETGKNNQSGTGGNTGEGGGDKEMSFWMCVSLLKKETAPIWILKRLAQTYMEHMKNKPEILQRLEASHDDEKLMEEAKNLLKDVTKGDPGEDGRDITAEDLRQYGLTQDEINRVFELFRSDGDEKKNQRVARDEFLRWAVLAVKSCLGLERTIRSSEHIFWKLDVLMSIFVVVLTVVIWLLLSELITTAQLAILFAPFVSASFVFGESMKAAFDGLIFAFGMHPFDVGNRVIINDVEMRVDELNILTTHFIKYNTGEEVVYPNSELAKTSIINLDITPDQSDSVEFTVPVECPDELVEDLQLRIKKTVDDDITYTSNTTVANKQISDKEITIAVYFKYLVSYLSSETKAKHRSNMLRMIVRLRKEMENAMNKIKEKYPSVQGFETLKFEIDEKEKLVRIEELKNKILGVLQSYQSLKDCSQVIFTEINDKKKKITMEVRIRHPADLCITADEKLKIMRQIVDEIKNSDYGVEFSP